MPAFFVSADVPSGAQVRSLTKRIRVGSRPGGDSDNSGRHLSIPHFPGGLSRCCTSAWPCVDRSTVLDIEGLGESDYLETEPARTSHSPKLICAA